LPAPSSVSFHGLDENTSSWGASVLHLPVGTTGKKQWTMFAAEMTHGCTLRHWTTNSEVVLAVADNATGPYTEKFQIIKPWSHNPEAILTTDGEVVVFTVGEGTPAHGPEYPCDEPSPPKPPPSPPPPPIPTGGGVHNYSFVIHHAPVHQVHNNKSAWQAHNATIIGFPIAFALPRVRGGHGGLSNPAPVALPDGRVRVMVHMGYSGYYNSSNQTIAGWSGEVIIEGRTWRGPYSMVSTRDITNCTHCQEDPFMWRDHRHNWHVLYHRLFDNGTHCTISSPVRQRYSCVAASLLCACAVASLLHARALYCTHALRPLYCMHTRCVTHTHRVLPPLTLPAGTDCNGYPRFNPGNERATTLISPPPGPPLSPLSSHPSSLTPPLLLNPDGSVPVRPCKRPEGMSNSLLFALSTPPTSTPLISSPELLLP
jgi:hypothetical protein